MGKSYKEKFKDEDGVWRTIGGRRVFIRTGQDLSSAMKESGKFKGKKLEKVENKKDKVNDDEKGFQYSFRTGKRDIFEVRYDRTGNNSEMDFATSANQFNRNRTDYSMGGQAQKDILKPNTRAMDFYNKWDNKHLHSLTGEEYNDLLKDVEGLKEKYPYIEGDRFYEQVEMDRNPDQYRQKKDLGKIGLNQKEISNLKDATKEYDPYKNTKYEKKYDSMDDVIKDPNSALNQYINDKEISNRVKENKIVDSFGNNVVYQNEKGNWINSKQNYNDYVNGKIDKLGGEFVSSEKQARDVLAGYDALEKVPYENNDENTKKWLEQKQKNLDKMYKSIGYDDSKYNYGYQEERTNKKDAFDFTQEEVDRAYQTMREKMQHNMDTGIEKWNGKAYTNAEFLAHLEDANWHSELHQLEDAKLTPQELEYIKNKTTLSSWGVGNELTGKTNVQKMIDEAKKNSSLPKLDNSSLQSAYENYLKEHKNSNMSYAEFKKWFNKR